MKTNQKMPSGMRGRSTTAKSIPLSPTRGKNLNPYGLRAMLVMLLFVFSIGKIWAACLGTAGAYVSAKSSATGQGLVYVTTKNTPGGVADSYYQEYSPGGSATGAGNENCYVKPGTNSGPHDCFYFAKPARGYQFKQWTNYRKETTGSCNPGVALNAGPYDGFNDNIQASAGGGDPTYERVVAEFEPATKYTITYTKPIGGSYTVGYSYLKTREKPGGEYEFYTDNNESYSMDALLESDIEVDSYEADKITLSVPAETTNFIGWYEGEKCLSTAKTYTEFKANHDATIRAEFKELAWGDVSGDLPTNVAAMGEFGNKTVYVAIPTLIGTWTAADFTIAPMNTSNSFGSIAIGTVSLDLANSRLVIPYTYTASNWGGVEANITITPAYGATKQFSIACSAEEVVPYEACIEESGVRTYTGTLAEMMTQANTMTNKPTVKLMQEKTITSPLSFSKSMTFDVNGKVLTANSASAFSIDAANTDVKIIDGSFTQVGEIHTSYASANPVSVVTFTNKAKLTMQGGTLSAANTGAGAAYGVDVQQGSILYMTGGNLTVTANTGNAQGVHVATASDYATFAGGAITVTAPTNAYGVWSAGSSNITNATINAQTTATTGAYGIYVNGGVSTLEGNTTTVAAATNNAFGAYVNAGRLNNNGGSFSVNAASDATGVHVAAGATAVLQQNASVTATATGASGTNVFGINNLGTVSLANITVTATSPTTAATAVNSTTSAVSTTIDGGTYRATAESGTAYALHHQFGTLNVDGGTFRAISNGNNVYGARAVADGTIANATIIGETRGTGNTAYGFVGGVANKNITLINCVITGQSNTSKAYAIYSRANVTATGCKLTATTLGANYACGFYAESGTNSSVNTNATVSSYTTQAYGVYHAAGSMSVNGGTYNVEAKQMTTAAAQNSELYGIYNAASQTTNVNGASFNAIAGNASYSQSVYGAYINGILNSNGATYNAEAKLNVYGVWGNTASTLNLSGNTISSRATNGTVSYGIYAKKKFTIDGDVVSAVGSTTGVYAMFFDASTSDGDVLSGKFSAQGNGTNGYGALNAAGTVGKVRLKGGVYKTTINLQKYTDTGYQVYHLDETHADYADGYRYTIAAENPSPYVCRIVGGAYYATLEEALQYTQDHSGTFTIVMTQNYTLPAGDYVLPSNATLVVPRKSGQTSITENGDPTIADKITAVSLNENFLCLTMASDAHLNVDGKIGVSGEMYCTQSGGVSNQSPYGRIHMESGSHIQLNSGAYLYAWGMITGTGSITVKSNAEVREMFQVKNMPAATALRYYVSEYTTSNKTRFMPFNQYSIQNIEVPTTYYHNSKLMTEMRCYYTAMGGFWYGDSNIKLVGTSGALFEVTSDDESSWVRKSYNTTTKQQVWEVNSAAQLGSISITMELPIVSTHITINSASYILPVTNTMKIHVIDGDFAITNDTELMPGASVEINKTASLTVKEGKKLYVFDKDQWSSSTSYADAAINVHGNINAQGGLYTTNPGGANIYSTNEDAGTVFFENAAPSTTTIDLITSVNTTNGTITSKTVTMDPALLKNGAGASPAFTPTSGTAKDHSFAYMNDVWTQTYTDGCFEFIGDNAYAKPSDYVELKKQRNDVGDYEDLYIKDNHTYISADESRIFIHLLDAEGACQWWEVEATSDPTVFECKKEGYEGFYYYDTSSEYEDEWKWQLKTVTVTFYSTEDGDDVLHTIVTDFNGRPDQSVIPSNPTKDTETGFTYQFYGWKSSETGTTYKWTDPLEEATEDMSYRPVFTATKRNYTVTLIDANNGATVPVEVPYGDIPSYEPKKDANEQYTYKFEGWTPDLQDVTGPATYTANWSSIVNRYTITWMDGETVLETDKHLEYGTATAFNGTLPTKETDNNFVYTFSGWKSSLTGLTYANGATPTVAGETTYSAQYTTTPRYKITFANYDGTDLQEDYYVTVGENPVYEGETPGRKRDFDGYYSFTGWKNSNGDDFGPNATLPVVTAKETYTAQYTYVTDLFEITLNNVDGAGATWSGYFGEGSTPYYDPDNDDVADKPTKAGNAQYSYPFTGWDPALEPVSETGQREYTAQFGEEINSYTITFANVDGNGTPKTVKVEYGQKPECPVKPTKEQGNDIYAFLSWSPAIVSVTGDATYTAQFSSTPTVRQGHIVFNLDNGSTPTEVDVDYGQTPAWSGETPTKPADAQYTYTFAGWYPEFAPVTGDETYFAQYTQSLNSYTVTFKNYDGTVLESKEWQYGATPSYSGTPSREFDEANSKTYTFNGWSPAVASVTDEATYTATYTESDLVATVTTSAGVTTPYNTWATALTAATGSANNTLKLYANVTQANNSYITVNRNLTINLNGYTISGSTSSTSYTYLFNVSAALTVLDTKGGGKISYTGSANRNCITINVSGSSASFTLESGTIESKKTSGTTTSYYSSAVTATSSAKVYIHDGELSANNQTARLAYVVNNSANNVAVTITGGKFKVSSTNNTYMYVFNGTYISNVTASGGYYSKEPGNITLTPGYQKVATTELAGYTHKVAPAEYTINLAKGTRGSADRSANVDFAATALKTFTPVTAAGYDCTGYFDGELKVLNADGTFAAETVSGYITDGKWSKASDCTLTANWSISTILEANESENIPVSETAAVEATIIHAGGIVDIETGKTLTTTDLILEATSSTSGQLVAEGAENIHVTGNAYFDWMPNGNEGTAYRTWYAIAVPWEVDAEEGIILKETGRRLVIGRDFDMIYYNGEKRGQEGNIPGCWEYVQWDVQGHDRQGNSRKIDKTVHPGRLYMMYFDPGFVTIRFVKKAEADVLYMKPVNVSLFTESTDNDGKDANWNGIANPRTYFASLSAGEATYAQVLNNGSLDDYFGNSKNPVYQTINLASSHFAVGKPLFVQAKDAVTVVVKKEETAGIVNAAPRRQRAETTLPKGIKTVYRLAIAGEDQPEADNMFVQVAEDEKADRYIIGQDLVKGGVAAKRAQIWVNRYDAKLSVNTQSLSNNEATYPLTIQIPTSGEYVLSAEPPTGGNHESALYLTRDGVAIWNLSDGAYTGSFEAGTTNEYGLRVSAKAPQITTDIDEAVVDAKGETRKVLINDNVFIIRGDKVYSMDGQMVK